MSNPILRGEARSKLSKSIWRRRKREGGKGTCAFCGKPIFAGGVKDEKKKYHKTCYAAKKAGLTRKQAGVANPRRKGEERGRGSPRTEKERRQRHERLYPGTQLPKRGTGRKQAGVANPRARRAWQFYGAELMNPRPPAQWWADMMGRISSEYPGASKGRLRQIVGGIWYNYSPAVRTQLIREYDLAAAANPRRRRANLVIERGGTRTIIALAAIGFVGYLLWKNQSKA